MSKSKIKWFLVAVGMVLGVVLIGWGWDKNESTIPERTHGAVVMIVAGAAMFIGSFIALVAGTNSGRS